MMPSDGNTSIPQDPHETNYLFDTESITEMARLLKLDALLTKGMGGLFSEQGPENLARVSRILDLACGPGGWALEVASTYPEKQVMGVDISKQMVDYASAQARSRLLSNVSFSVMNVLQPLPFPDASFDLVNIRYIFSFVPADAWPALLQECRRILTSGGVLRCTEPERHISTSAALMRSETLTAHLIYQIGRTPTVDPSFYGIICCLPAWFRQAGFAAVQTRGYVIDFSAGTEFHALAYENYKVFWIEAASELVRRGLIDQSELELLIQQAHMDILSSDFKAAQFYATVWGSKQ